MDPEAAVAAGPRRDRSTVERSALLHAQQPVSDVPRRGRPGVPSSATSSSSIPSASRIDAVTRAPAACLSVLVSASWTIR